MSQIGWKWILSAEKDKSGDLHADAPTDRARNQCRLNDFMAAKRYRSISPHKTSNEATASTADNVCKPKICVICGDIARYVNYGALSCQSCKTFFRRNGYRPEAVRPCLLNKICEVNMQTRHNCTACRLTKCLAMGMASELIRKEDCKRPKLSPSTESKPSPPINPPPTSRVPPGDAQLLSESQWSLLTNIVHAYDTFNMIPRVRQAIETLSAYADGETPKVLSPVEIIDQMCTAMQRFISSSPDFRVLTRTEQESLLERNLFGVVALYSTYVFRQSGMLNTSHYLSAFVGIYGVDAISSLNRIIDQLDVDDTVLKIVLLAFAFSSNCVFVNSDYSLGNDSLLYGTFRLLGSQNVYADLLWNYLVYHYGGNQAALRFTRLVQLFLCMVKNLASLYSSNDKHRRISDQALDKTKRMLPTIETEQTLLWGKGPTV